MGPQFNSGFTLDHSGFPVPVQRKEKHTEGEMRVEERSVRGREGGRRSGCGTVI